ncbi:hypothetical protein HN928_02190, partial [bacterium]|nr:hypothetical protein [bacterium]
MEKKEFFQEATLRICGNLEIEEALQQLLQLLKKVMPVSEVFLQYFDQNYNALRTIARATETECKKLDTLSPLTKEVSAMVGNVPVDKDAILINDPQGFPVTREMGALYQQQATSVIILFLRTNGETLGFLVLISEESKPFSEVELT